MRAQERNAAATAPVAELADAVDLALRADLAHFAPPGHKRQRLDQFGDLLQSDITLLTGVDDQSLSRNLLPRAEGALARLWGADWARISVQGSSHVNQSVVLGLAGSGSGEIVIARNAHRSVMTGLVLSGLTPIWLRPETTASGLIAGVPPARVEAALSGAHDAKAVLLVEPSYTGAVSDIAAIVANAAPHGVPVVVDQAWGAHFGFHPALPPGALQLGADLTVISVHKTLPALTQSAVLLGSARVRDDGVRIRNAFDSLLTTSPSAAIYASVDRARQFMAAHGGDYLGRAVRRAARLRRALSTIPGVACDGAEPLHCWTAWQDPLKLTIDISATGLDGRAVDSRLRELGVQLSLATSTYLVALLTLADTEAKCLRLSESLRAIVASGPGRPVPKQPELSILETLPEAVMTPRQAVLAPHRFVPLEAAGGAIGGEVIAPYPPGIAAVVPGERLSCEVVAALRLARSLGVAMSGCSDPGLAMVRVLASR